MSVKFSSTNFMKMCPAVVQAHGGANRRNFAASHCERAQNSVALKPVLWYLTYRRVEGYVFSSRAETDWFLLNLMHFPWGIIRNSCHVITDMSVVVWTWSLSHKDSEEGRGRGLFEGTTHLLEETEENREIRPLFQLAAFIIFDKLAVTDTSWEWYQLRYTRRSRRKLAADWKLVSVCAVCVALCSRSH